MQEYYTYQLRLETDENPFYVGKGLGNRWKQHLSPSKIAKGGLKNNKIAKAIREGVKVLVEKLKEGLSEEDAFAEERILIEFYGRRDLKTGCLTNLTSGGEGQSGRVITSEFRLKMSESAKVRGISSETREKITAALVGKKASQETKEKMSLAHKGRITTESHRLALSKALTGKRHSPETLAKLSLSAKTRVRKPVSDAARLNMAEAARKRYREKENGIT